MLENVTKYIRISDPTKKNCSSDWPQKLGLRVSRPGDSENPLRSAYFFQKLFFFGIFLTTILKIIPASDPNQRAFIDSLTIDY